MALYVVDCRGRVSSFLCAILKCRLPWISCTSSRVQRLITFSVRSSEHRTSIFWSQLSWVARRVGFPSLSICSGLWGLYGVRVVARGFGVGAKRPSGGRIMVSVVWESTIGCGKGRWMVRVWWGKLRLWSGCGDVNCVGRLGC